jgi:hypothetical protein
MPRTLRFQVDVVTGLETVFGAWVKLFWYARFKKGRFLGNSTGNRWLGNVSILGYRLGYHHCAVCIPLLSVAQGERCNPLCNRVWLECKYLPCKPVSTRILGVWPTLSGLGYYPSPNAGQNIDSAYLNFEDAPCADSRLWPSSANGHKKAPLGGR